MIHSAYSALVEHDSKSIISAAAMNNVDTSAVHGSLSPKVTVHSTNSG